MRRSIMAASTDAFAASASAVWHPTGSTGHDRVLEPSGGVADRLVEDRQAERKFVLGGGQWWGDPENAAHSGQLHDVHVQTQFETAFGDERAQLVGTAFGLAVDDQFEAGQ